MIQNAYFCTSFSKNDRNKVKKETWRKIKYPVLVAGIHMFIFTVRLLPRKLELARFKFRSRLAALLVKKERQKCEQNIKYAYGDSMTDKEVRKMSNKMFEHLAMNFCDMAYSFHYRTREQFLKIWEVKGEEHLKAAYEQGRGVLVSTCHVGSWEFSAIAPPILGYETSAVSAPLKNKRIDALVVGSREARGMKNIHRGKGRAMPLILKALKRGECLVIMIDQDIIAKGCFVDFYDKPAFTTIGAAKIAMEADVPIVTMVTRRLPNNKHCVEFFPAIEVTRTGNVNSDLIENTKRIHAPIEALIKESPEQWVWFHERWKRQPETIDPKLVVKEN